VNDRAAITQVLTNYYRAFSTLDVQTFLPFFHQPCLVIGPQGVLAAPTPAVLATAFVPALESLRAKGYGRSELNLEKLEPLSATAALATGVAVRYKADGQELDRAGVTYLLHKAETGWRIAVLVIHDAPRDLRENNRVRL
jgi:ketosteroid isomerase-like protein